MKKNLPIQSSSHKKETLSELEFRKMMMDWIVFSFKEVDYGIDSIIEITQPILGTEDDVDEVMQKYGLKNVDWKTLYFWTLCSSTPFYIVTFLISATVREELKTFTRHPLSKNYFALFGQNVSTIVGNGIGLFALSFLPITIKKLIESFSSLMVHLIASKGSKLLMIEKEENFSLVRFLLIIVCGLAACVLFLSGQT